MHHVNMSTSSTTINLSKLSSPITSHIHLNKNFKNCVYEPSEDTFLFLDALEEDLIFLINQCPTLVVEIGSGSGCIGVFLLQLFKKCQSIPICHKPQQLEKLLPVPFLLSVDINKVACEATLETARVNGISSIDSLCSSLLKSLRKSNIDVIIFNPPYVPSESYQIEWRSGNLTSAWAGGVNGREVIDAFLDQVPAALSQNGILYLLAEGRNDIESLIEKLISMGFQVSRILERKIRNERLVILRGSRCS